LLHAFDNEEVGRLILAMEDGSLTEGKEEEWVEFSFGELKRNGNRVLGLVL
jgi:hypothetical protein